MSLSDPPPTPRPGQAVDTAAERRWLTGTTSTRRALTYLDEIDRLGAEVTRLTRPSTPPSAYRHWPERYDLLARYNGRDRTKDAPPLPDAIHVGMAQLQAEFDGKAFIPAATAPETHPAPNGDRHFGHAGTCPNHLCDAVRRAAAPAPVGGDERLRDAAEVVRRWTEGSAGPYSNDLTPHIAMRLLADSVLTPPAVSAPVRYEQVEGTAWNTTSGRPVLVLSDEMTPRHEPLFRAVPSTGGVGGDNVFSPVEIEEMAAHHREMLAICPSCGNDAELGAPDAGPDEPDHGEYDCLTCGYQFVTPHLTGTCRRCGGSADEHPLCPCADVDEVPGAVPSTPAVNEEGAP